MQQVGAGAINGKTPLNKMPPNGFPDWRADQHGNGNGNGMEPNLSVVTTVWGMSSATQSGPYSSFSGGGGNPGSDGLNNNGTNTSSSGGYMKGPQFWTSPNQYSGGTTFTQNRSEGQNNGGGSQEYGNSNPLGMAMVTAIATASATATVVALQERQDGGQYAMNSMPTHQYNMMHYNNSGNNHPAAANPTNQSQKMGPGPMNPGMNSMKMPSHPQGEGGSSFGRNRSSPYSYPNPSNSHINQKRGHMNQSMGPNPNFAAPPGVVPQQAFDGSNIYGLPEPQNHSNYANQPNPRMMFRGPGRGAAASGARQIPNPNNLYMPPNTGQYYNPNGPRSSGPAVNSMHHPHNGPPPNYSHMMQQQQHSSMQSMHYQNGLPPSASFPPESPGPLPPYSSVGEPKSLRTFQQSPIPGNPTPPLTPGSGGCCSLNSLGESKPVIHSAKHDNELRLTFPVRDGTILAPFRLEHNLAVSNHVFHLKPTVHQTLTWRSDLELQLKCFHHEDRQMNTNWPTSVQVSVNAIPLSIDRGDNKVSHRPLYLKDICLPGRNTLQITVSACCCSHLFVLQLVHRPSVRSVLQGLLRKRLLPSEHCVTKIKRHFNNSYGSQSAHDGDGVEQTAIKVSLKCPITYKRMGLPARGHDCRHVQCFDLESYLQMNCERAAWRCPVCNKSAQLEGLEVDQYIWSILNSLEKSDSDEVTIDSAANWREAKSGVSANKTKSEEPESCSAKKTKLIRPQEIPTPVWNSDAVLSPYNPPTMSSISMGPGVNYNGWNDVQNPYEFGGDHGDPLNRLKESVNSIDALNAMERSIRETGTIPVSHVKQEMSKGDIPYILHTPQTPHTPGTSEIVLNPSSPLIVPNTSKSHHHQDSDTALLSSDLPSDLNFDPESVINGDGSGPDELNLLPNSGVDPLELLSYLEPSGLATPPSSGDRDIGNNSNVNSTPDSLSDDLLALFD